MGWAVVLDPYVAWQADSSAACCKIVSTIYYSAEHAFVLDKGQVLLEKYEQLANGKPESWVRQLYEYLVEQQQSTSVSSHVLSLQPPFAKSAYCCDGNVERAEKVMVDLASGQNRTALVTLDPDSRSNCPGRWLFWNEDCYRKLCDQRKVCFKFTDSWDWIYEPYPPFPNTKEGLEEFLKQHGGGRIQETEQLEFKYPGSPDGSLTESIVTATCKAICAMANSGGGYVFIGITQDNRISGVRLTYNNRPRELDEMQRLILPQHCRFQPDVPVDCMWPIQIAPDRYVFAFYISRKTRQVWEYNGKRYVRRGTQSIVR